MITEVADDDQDYEVQISPGTPVSMGDKSSDPFDDISKLKLGRNLKRRINNKLSKNLEGKSGVQSKRIDWNNAISGYDAFEVIQPPHNLEYLAQLYEKSYAHAAAVSAKVYNTVGLGYDFLETDKTKDRIERATSAAEVDKLRRTFARRKQQLFDWLDNCNTMDTFNETLIKWFTDYETTGNAFLEIGRDDAGNVGYIGHIPATTMRIRRRRDGFVQVSGRSAVFFRNYGDQKTPDPINGDTNPSEVIFLHKYTPTNGYYGVPDIMSAITQVAGMRFSGQYNLDYFENKAVPRYIIIIKNSNLSKSSQQKLFSFFESVKGQNHRSIIIPLKADNKDSKVEFEMRPVENGVQEASFSKYDKGNIAAIHMAHRVPQTKTAGSENIQLAAARDADKTFKEQVTRPVQMIIEKKFGKVISELGNSHYFKLTELSLNDELTQAKIDDVYLKDQVILPNEVRARRGMPGIKSGDKPLVLNPKASADRTANAQGNRQRDAQRATTAPDVTGDGRNAKGDGRQVG